MGLFHQTDHDDGLPPKLSLLCAHHHKEHGVRVRFVPADGGSRSLAAEDSNSAISLRIDAVEVQQLDWSDPKGLLASLPAEDATPLIDRLATARELTLEHTEALTLRFDLAKGRPAIADFRNKCRTILGAAGPG